MGTVGKLRRRGAARPDAGRSDPEITGAADMENPPPGAAPIKTAVVLSPAAHRRLQAACLYLGRTQSELVEEVINDRFSGYYTGYRDPRRATVGQTVGDE